MPDLAKWQQAQIRAAVARGINPIDAIAAVKVAAAAMPAGSDPDAYIMPAWMLAQDLARAEYQVDANAAWYSQQAGGRYAALLDAVEGDG